ncbi:hypothetical protein F4776DRAFT_665252 [Hypoxylon sp. NC0597]|nr:hypothetical protein F4776DRAFT_665252 [Hypoxylon sp. NC0597]
MVFTIQKVDDIEGQRMTIEEPDLTIGVLRAMICQRYTTGSQGSVAIQGLGEDAPDHALVREYISGTEILWSSLLGQSDQEQASKSLKGRPGDKLNISKNDVANDAKQDNVIQPPEKCDRAIEADISENKAKDKAVQRNVITYEKISFKF